MDLFSHYLQIVFLGIVEGVTEFLPISSTGHLLLAEKLIHSHEPDIFNLVIQTGAILAVVFVYRHKIADLLGNLDKRENSAYLLQIFAAFVVTALVGLLLTQHFHLKLPATLLPVAWAIFTGGLVIFAVEFLAKELYPHEDVSWPEAIAIGLGQVLSVVFPGASRPAAGIMTAMALGTKRTTATEFSLLLGIPTILAASALDLFRSRNDLLSGDHQLLLDLALGFVVSALVAFFVVKWLLRFIQSHTFNGFATYRLLLGGGLLIAIYTGALPESDAAALQSPPPVVQVQPAPPSPPSPAPPAVAPPDVPPPAPPVDTNAAPISPMPPTNDTSSPLPATNTGIPQRALPVDPADLPPPAPASTNQPPANVPAPQK